MMMSTTKSQRKRRNPQRNLRILWILVRLSDLVMARQLRALGEIEPVS
jgi:hypothetical protein